MGVLDTVLRYKEQKDAQKNADISAIPQAMMQFQAGRQQATDNLLKSLTLQATLAQAGLKIGQQGNQYSIAQDPNSLAYQKSSLDQRYKESQISKNESQMKNAQSSQKLLDEQLNGGGSNNSVGGFGTMLSGVNGSGKPVFKNDTPLDMANRASGLRRELTADPVVKNFKDISSRIGTLDNLLASYGADTKSYGTKDQAMITTFNKITDPGSVVRESEYARTPEGQSLIDNFTGRVERLKMGGAGITPEYRKQLVEDAKAIADGVGNNYNQILSGYEEMAGRYKVDPKDVFGSLKKHEGFSKSGDRYEYKTINGVQHRRKISNG